MMTMYYIVRRMRKDRILENVNVPTKADARKTARELRRICEKGDKVVAFRCASERVAI